MTLEVAGDLVGGEGAAGHLDHRPELVVDVDAGLRERESLNPLGKPLPGVRALIVSAEFEGLTRVRRHQRVYAALGERMREEIHALSMTTLTPDEWARGRAPA